MSNDRLLQQYKIEADRRQYKLIIQQDLEADYSKTRVGKRRNKQAQNNFFVRYKASSILINRLML